MRAVRKYTCKTERRRRSPTRPTRGGAMQRARIKAGLTRQELADYSGVGYNVLGKWERDDCIPRISELELLADALGIGIDEYIGRIVPPPYIVKDNPWEVRW